jgi:hypothetical protein
MSKFTYDLCTTEHDHYSLIGAMLMIRLMNSRNKKEKIYFLATKYVNKPSEQFAKC